MCESKITNISIIKNKLRTLQLNYMNILILHLQQLSKILK